MTKPLDPDEDELAVAQRRIEQLIGTINEQEHRIGMAWRERDAANQRTRDADNAVRAAMTLLLYIFTRTT